MKIPKIRLVSLLTAVVIVALAGVSAPAVIYAQSQLGLNIPFDFYVGSQKFEPGDYTVLVSGSYLKISDRRNHSVFVLTSPVANPGWRSTSGGALVFNRYDNYYFLTEVRRGGYSSANGLLKAPLEIQVARISATKEQIAFQSGH